MSFWMAAAGRRRKIAMTIISINCCCLDSIAIVAPPPYSLTCVITNCFFRTPLRKSKMNIKTKDGKIIINIEY